MDQASRIAWYKQQVPRAKEGKLNTSESAEVQLRQLLEMAKVKEIFPELAIADIGRLVYIALADLATDCDALWEIHEESKWLAGPDLAAVDRALSMKQTALAVAAQAEE